MQNKLHYLCDLRDLSIDVYFYVRYTNIKNNSRRIQMRGISRRIVADDGGSNSFLFGNHGNMHTRTFTFEDQKLFAHISGDFNPLHMDEISARRTQFGQPVVHGIHLVLWALDCWLHDQTTSVELTSLRVLFQKSVFLDQEVSCSFSHQKDHRFKIKIVIDNTAVSTILFDYRITTLNSNEKIPSSIMTHPHCKLLTPREVQQASGELPLYLDVPAAEKLFPTLVRRMPLSQIAEILATSRLVGMECPGYNSLFLKLDASFQKHANFPLTLTYKATDYGEVYSLLSISIFGPSIQGTVQAFLRPGPKEQASYIHLRKHVKNQEFKGQNALIIGGSRGLGEVSAKLLASGGAKVRITYHKGKEDADRIVNDIRAGGGHADYIPFNVLDIEQKSADQMNDDFRPTHLYYFATPPIFTVRYKDVFSPELFDRFYRYYVAGFAATIERFKKTAPDLQNIFYPSSVAIDECIPALTEYICAKAAGETFCALLEKYYENVYIYRPRLPRLATDQTINLLDPNDPDPSAPILAHLRIFHNYGNGQQPVNHRALNV